MQVRKQQLELYMEQQTGSKLGKEYIMNVGYVDLSVPLSQFFYKSKTIWNFKS